MHRVQVDFGVALLVGVVPTHFWCVGRQTDAAGFCTCTKDEEEKLLPSLSFSLPQLLSALVSHVGALNMISLLESMFYWAFLLPTAVWAVPELKQVHVVTRHGARTPLPKNAETLVEQAGSTLTPIGQKQLYVKLD